MDYRESEAIRKCQEGDRAAFGQVYDSYVGKIYGFVYFKTMHKEAAEDLTSQIFLKAMEKIERFDPDTNFSAWIFTIARNCVIDYFRAQKEELCIEDVWGLSDNEDLERDFENKERLVALKEYLSTLQPEQREIILMRFWCDMSFREMSAALGKSEGSLKMAMSRMMRQARQEDVINIVITAILIR